MSISPIELSESQRIGTVDFVSPSEIKVALDLEAPENTALNSGSPTAFPRVNSYLIIPNESGYIVGQVEWLAVERAPFPKRKGLQDFGLIDLPFQQRKLCLNPVGTLSLESQNRQKTEYKLKRGVYSFPSIGAPVLLPTDLQSRSIIESGEDRRVLIGHAPLAGNAEVRVDPDRLFGRHLAVLGNTGSGKSCTVAGLIKWSLDEAKKNNENAINARFIILDPNGEYKNVFKDDKSNPINYFMAESQKVEEQLRVPYWMWNSEEWAGISNAANRAQKPLLKNALRFVRSNECISDNDTEAVMLRRKISGFVSILKGHIAGQKHKLKSTPLGYILDSFSNDFVDISSKISIHNEDLNSLIGSITGATRLANPTGGKFYNAFDDAGLMRVLTQAKSLLDQLGGMIPERNISEDTPLPFDGDEFINTIEQLAEIGNIPHLIDFLITRIQTMLGDARMIKIIGADGHIDLKDWLSNYIGDQTSQKSITVIDLSLVPSEIVQLISAVISRITLESLQRYRRLHPKSKSLPTILVMEEAHTFIKRYRDNSDEATSSEACCRVFEKIAREGRKFGLGLVLSSQRPSELSPTVLSQCNSFILHRINNDKDQEAVSKLLPDYLRGMLRELPVLPSQHAFLLGWASELPVLTKMLDLPKMNQPQSDDPDFWDVWTGKESREVNWQEIADDWQGISKDTHIEPESSAGTAAVDDFDPFADE